MHFIFISPLLSTKSHNESKVQKLLAHQLTENTDNEQRDPHSLTENLLSRTTTASASWWVLRGAASSSVLFPNLSAIDILGQIIPCCVTLSWALLDT